MGMLNKKYFLHFSIILCFILRIHHEIQFPLLDSDYATQIEAAKNYNNGHGFSNKIIDIKNISDPKFELLKKWPVGYPMLVWFFHLFTRDWIWAQLFIQCLSVVLFVYAFKKLVELFTIQPAIQSLVFIWMAFSPAPFFYLGTSDQLTAALFLLSVYFILKAIKLEAAVSADSIIGSLLLFLSAALRFACIPNLVIVPFFLFLIFIFQRKKYLFLMSAFIFSGSLILTFTFYKLFPIDTTRTNFMQNLLHLNLYYENMKWFDPFPVKAFLFTRPFEFHFPHHPVFLLCYRIGMLVLSVLLCTSLVRFLFKSEKAAGVKAYLKRSSDKVNLNLLFITSCMIIIGFISMQSLTTGPEKNSFGPSWMPPLWTFVYSTRYFILPMVLLILMAVIWMNEKLVINDKLKIFPSLIYTMVFLFSFFYFLFINYQVYSVNGNGGGSNRFNWKDEFSIIKIIQEEKGKEPAEEIFITSYARDGYNAPIVLMADAGYITDYSSVVQGNFNCSAGNNILYVYAPKDLSEEAKSKLAEKGTPLEDHLLANGILYKFKIK